MLLRALLATLLLFAVLTAATAVRYGAPTALGPDAPADRFSGQRARNVLREILGDGSPHPTGSDSQRQVRTRIVLELTRLGYAPEVQDSFACGKYGSCAFASNVVARLPGTEAGSAVLLAAHYDSVPAGPGANDDGSGTASILEIARALKAGPPLKHAVVLLLDDAEEAGLNGAEAFARDPRMAEVRAAVNLDARGSSGPSILFETSRNNAWIIDLAASALPRPVTSSLYYAVYQRMPNDTDFTVFKRTAHGANFAYTGSIQNYHTPNDNLDNARADVFQHHGDNALAMVRAFAMADLDSKKDGDAVWFDVLAAFIIHWNEHFTIFLAAIALALAVAALRMRARVVGVFPLVVGFLTMPLVVFAAALAAGLVGVVVKAAGGLPAPWVATATPLLGALYFASIAAAALVSSRASRSADPDAMRAGIWAAWSAAGVFLAWSMPGMSFLFLVPALAAGVAGLFRAHGPIASGLAAVVAALFWIPVAWLLYPGIGMVAPAAHGAVVGVLLTTLVPLFSGVSARVRSRFAAFAGGCAVVFSIVAAVSAPFSPTVPSRANVVFHQDASNDGAAPKARTFVDSTWGGLAWGPVPTAMRDALGPSAHPDHRFAWSLESDAAEATPIDAPPPEFVVTHVEDRPGGRTIVARLKSPRGARTLFVAFPPASEARLVRANGFPMTPARSLGPLGWTYATFFAVPPEGIDLEVVAGVATTDVTIFDLTSGVPSSAASIVAARPASAVPTQEGDATEIARRVHL